MNRPLWPAFLLAPVILALLLSSSAYSAAETPIRLDTKTLAARFSRGSLSSLVDRAGRVCVQPPKELHGLGIHLLKSRGWVHLHPKPGAVGTTIIGGLIFGVGFATLGYCPGTIAGAIGQGSLDALTGGLVGILVGAWEFATFYPKLQKPILSKGDFGTRTLPELLKVKTWFIVIPLAILLTLLLVGLEVRGL